MIILRLRPSIADQRLRKKYNVPISLWLVDMIHRIVWRIHWFRLQI